MSFRKNDQRLLLSLPPPPETQLPPLVSPSSTSGIIANTNAGLLKYKQQNQQRHHVALILSKRLFMTSMMLSLLQMRSFVPVVVTALQQKSTNNQSFKFVQRRTLEEQSTQKQQQGTWWMVATEGKDHIDIHAAATTTIDIDGDGYDTSSDINIDSTNDSYYNEEDTFEFDDEAPILSTCSEKVKSKLQQESRDDPISTSSNAGYYNRNDENDTNFDRGRRTTTATVTTTTTTIPVGLTMELELDHVLNIPMNKLLKKLQVHLIRNIGDILCSSSIHYMMPSSSDDDDGRRKRRHLRRTMTHVQQPQQQQHEKISTGTTTEFVRSLQDRKNIEREVEALETSNQVLEFHVDELVGHSLRIVGSCEEFFLLQQAADSCVKVHLNMDVMVTPAVPSDISVTPVHQMLADLINGMVNNEEDVVNGYDEFDLSDTILGRNNTGLVAVHHPSPVIAPEDDPVYLRDEETNDTTSGETTTTSSETITSLPLNNNNLDEKDNTNDESSFSAVGILLVFFTLLVFVFVSYNLFYEKAVADGIVVVKTTDDDDDEEVDKDKMSLRKALTDVFQKDLNVGRSFRRMKKKKKQQEGEEENDDELFGIDNAKSFDTIGSYFSDGHAGSTVASTPGNSPDRCNMVSSIDGDEEENVYCDEAIMNKKSLSNDKNEQGGTKQQEEESCCLTPSEKWAQKHNMMAVAGISGVEFMPLDLSQIEGSPQTKATKKQSSFRFGSNSSNISNNTHNSCQTNNHGRPTTVKEEQEEEGANDDETTNKKGTSTTSSFKSRLSRMLDSANEIFRFPYSCSEKPSTKELYSEHTYNVDGSKQEDTNTVGKEEIDENITKQQDQVNTSKGHIRFNSFSTQRDIDEYGALPLPAGRITSIMKSFSGESNHPLQTQPSCDVEDGSNNHHHHHQSSSSSLSIKSILRRPSSSIKNDRMSEHHHVDNDDDDNTTKYTLASSKEEEELSTYIRQSQSLEEVELEIGPSLSSKKIKRRGLVGRRASRKNELHSSNSSSPTSEDDAHDGPTNTTSHKNNGWASVAKARAIVAKRKLLKTLEGTAEIIEEANYLRSTTNNNDVTLASSSLGDEHVVSSMSSPTRTSSSPPPDASFRLLNQCDQAHRDTCNTLSRCQQNTEEKEALSNAGGGDEEEEESLVVWDDPVRKEQRQNLMNDRLSLLVRPSHSLDYSQSVLSITNSQDDDDKKDEAAAAALNSSSLLSSNDNGTQMNEKNHAFDAPNSKSGSGDAVLPLVFDNNKINKTKFLLRQDDNDDDDDDNVDDLSFTTSIAGTTRSSPKMRGGFHDVVERTALLSKLRFGDEYNKKEEEDCAGSSAHEKIGSEGEMKVLPGIDDDDDDDDDGVLLVTGEGTTTTGNSNTLPVDQDRRLPTDNNATTKQLGNTLQQHGSTRTMVTSYPPNPDPIQHMNAGRAIAHDMLVVVGETPSLQMSKSSSTSNLAEATRNNDVSPTITSATVENQTRIDDVNDTIKFGNRPRSASESRCMNVKSKNKHYVPPPPPPLSPKTTTTSRTTTETLESKLTNETGAKATTNNITTKRGSTAGVPVVPKTIVTSTFGGKTLPLSPTTPKPTTRTFDGVSQKHTTTPSRMTVLSSSRSPPSTPRDIIKDLQVHEAELGSIIAMSSTTHSSIHRGNHKMMTTTSRKTDDSAASSLAQQPQPQLSPPQLSQPQLSQPQPQPHRRGNSDNESILPHDKFEVLHSSFSYCEVDDEDDDTTTTTNNNNSEIVSTTSTSNAATAAVKTEHIEPTEGEHHEPQQQHQQHHDNETTLKDFENELLKPPVWTTTTATTTTIDETNHPKTTQKNRTIVATIIHENNKSMDDSSEIHDIQNINHHGGYDADMHNEDEEGRIFSRASMIPKTRRHRQWLGDEVDDDDTNSDISYQASSILPFDER